MIQYFNFLLFAANTENTKKEIIQIDIYIGLMDFPNQLIFANDYIETNIKGTLVNLCQEKQFFCNMKFDTNIINPKIHRFLKDTDQNQFIVTIYNSAFANDLELSLDQFPQEQAKHSVQIQHAFVNSLKQSHKVIYIGHSRFGGGPDFELPKYKTGTSDLDLSHYQRSKKGLHQLIAGLKQRPKSLPLDLSLISCDSNTHFLNQIKTTHPRLNLQLQNNALSVDQALFKLRSILN